MFPGKSTFRVVSTSSVGLIEFARRVLQMNWRSIACVVLMCYIALYTTHMCVILSLHAVIQLCKVV